MVSTFLSNQNVLIVMPFSVIPEEVQLDARWEVYLFAIFEWFILILSLELIVLCFWPEDGLL